MRNQVESAAAASFFTLKFVPSGPITKGLIRGRSLRVPDRTMDRHPEKTLKRPATAKLQPFKFRYKSKCV
jgi:hypothetical protein